jgi:hypothetical protein
MTITSHPEAIHAGAPARTVCPVCGSRSLGSSCYDEVCAARIQEAAAIVGRTGISENQMTKAMGLIWAGRATPAVPVGLFHVVSSDGSAIYVTGIAFCTCPARVTCYHMIAVVILLVVRLGWDPPS